MEKRGLPSWIRGVCGDGSRQYPSPATGPDLKERDSKIGPVKRKAPPIATPSDRKTGREDGERTSARLDREKAIQGNSGRCNSAKREPKRPLLTEHKPAFAGAEEGRGSSLPVTLARRALYGSLVTLCDLCA